MNIQDNWTEIKQLFDRTVKTNKHYAVASVDKDGNPHITPIGSLILNTDCTGFYFEKFPERTRQNFETNDRIAVMTVNTGFFFWFKSIRKGGFQSPPGVRLYGKVGKRRHPTDREKALWLNKVHFARRTKGYAILWKDMAHVRDIYFDDARPVNTGAMTRNLWK